MTEKQEPCKRCNFDDEFITDYDYEGTEFVFCGNCGTRVPEAIVRQNQLNEVEAEG